MKRIRQYFLVKWYSYQLRRTFSHIFKTILESDYDDAMELIRHPQWHMNKSSHYDVIADLIEGLENKVKEIHGR